GKRLVYEIVEEATLLSVRYGRWSVGRYSSGCPALQPHFEALL
ncbi:hypothetical protein CCACVL1_03062, partial [Corchorus capsularis]